MQCGEARRGGSWGSEDWRKSPGSGRSRREQAGASLSGPLLWVLASVIRLRIAVARVLGRASGRDDDEKKNGLCDGDVVG